MGRKRKTQKVKNKSEIGRKKERR